MNTLSETILINHNIDLNDAHGIEMSILDLADDTQTLVELLGGATTSCEPSTLENGLKLVDRKIATIKTLIRHLMETKNPDI